MFQDLDKINQGDKGNRIKQGNSSLNSLKQDNFQELFGVNEHN